MKEATILEQRHTRTELYILTASYFFVYFGVGAIQPYLGPYLEKTTGRPGTETAWVLGSVYLFGIIGRLITVSVVDRMGPRFTIFLGLAFCTGFSWLVVAAPFFWALIAGAAFWGWGAACLWVAGPTLVLDTAADEKYGKATSILYSSVFLSQGLGVCLLGWVADRWGDERLFLVAAAITVLSNLIALKLPSRPAKVARPALVEGFRMLLSPQGLILSFLLLSSSFGFGILLGNLSSSVAESSTGLAGAQMGRIGVVTLGFYVARLVFGWYAGPLSDKLGRSSVLILGYGTACLGLVSAGLTSHPAVLFIAGLCLGIQMGCSSVTITALVGDWAPPEKRPLVLGTLFIWNGVGAAMTIILGQYLKTLLHGYRPTFTIFGLVMGACCILSFVLGRLPRPAAEAVQEAC